MRFLLGTVVEMIGDPLSRSQRSNPSRWCVMTRAKASAGFRSYAFISFPPKNHEFMMLGC